MWDPQKNYNCDEMVLILDEAVRSTPVPDATY